ncbi:hypothetical protein [Kitasatospora sp. NPDC097691]|uniref:hypothetical protein n=1 Tax=Kitasatospora sp. NPDC097691 TaxID=3157231 RepID=UPI0033185839
MRAGRRGPAPPSTAAVLRAGALGVAGACALLAAGAAPAAAGGSLISVVDNSNADSWLEVDRTANLQNGSGSAGSDHDGAGSLVGGLLGPAPSAGPARRQVTGGGP